MKRIFFIASILIGTIACTSDDEPINSTNSSGGFYALRVGNIWVYKNYRLNSGNQYNYTGVIDSIEIISTEEIDDIKYYKFKRKTTGNEDGITFCNPNGTHYELLRDSLGYLIKSDGTIKCVNNDYNERIVLEQSWGNIYEELQNNTEIIDVEAGQFDCIDTHRYSKDVNDVQFSGLDHFYYADGIGLIMDTSSFASSTLHTIERRLESYHVQ